MFKYAKQKQPFVFYFSDFVSKMKRRTLSIGAVFFTSSFSSEFFAIGFD